MQIVFTTKLIAALVLTVNITGICQLAPPLVDGNCGEYKTLGSDSLKLDDQVTLYFYQDKHYLWMCYNYLEGSYGTLDLKLDTDQLVEPINLHVSGQLGEWPANDPEAAPKNPESDKWWNNIGWTANPIWINGMDKSGETPRYRFKNALAREMQLSKGRFGRGDWKFTLEIRSLKNPKGEYYNITFPAAGSQHLIHVN